jgi:hypothetical protein
MKRTRIILQACVIALFVLSFTAKTQDADQQKLIQIEKAFAATTSVGPDSAAVSKQYLYDGNVSQLTPMGRNGTLPKARVVELSGTPDPNDPNFKSATSVSDFHVDLYGDTALVGYKLVNTDSGHKDPALDTTDHMGCLDTFVKRNGQWYLIANACAMSTPISAAERAAVKKAIATEPKDVQAAYR